jgi:hypothetical protein
MSNKVELSIYCTHPLSRNPIILDSLLSTPFDLVNTMEKLKQTCRGCSIGKLISVSYVDSLDKICTIHDDSDMTNAYDHMRKHKIPLKLAVRVDKPLVAYEDRTIVLWDFESIALHPKYTTKENIEAIYRAVKL